ncbi:MAG: glycerate kinase, partial [Actinobacteria bacterium]|nr:glycerate kinase [Actinomycetota bacterium]
MRRWSVLTVLAAAQFLMVLDQQSAAGKVVGAVAARCRAAAVPCFAVVGRSTLDGAAAVAMGLAGVV